LVAEDIVVVVEKWDERFDSRVDATVIREVGMKWDRARKLFAADGGAV
jgi:hypothetical protein